MAPHRPHSPDELNDALEHIVYEIWKYRQSVKYYAQLLRFGDVAIEFRVLHHRILLDFFYSGPKHADNVLAQEYIADWTKRHDPKGQSWLDDYLRRCHTMLAHISVTRTAIARAGLEDWGDEWPRVEAHLNKIIIDFLRALSPERQELCSKWINKWSADRFPGGDALVGLAASAGLP
jgi:hypothetical protein